MLWFSLALAAPPAPPPVRVVEHLGDRYHVVTVDLGGPHRLDLVGQGPTAGIRTFADVAAWAGDDLVAATNAGIFHAPEQPVGLFVSEHVTHHALETAPGAGNFYLEPNGVFALGPGGARVQATPAYRDRQDRLATQSGPALLLDRAVHPAFRPGSTNRRARSGIGVSGEHTVHIVLSDGPVRFHDFATLFRDELHCTDALYLDGVISGLLADGAPRPPDHAYAGFLVVRRAPRQSLRANGSHVLATAVPSRDRASRARGARPQPLLQP